MAQVSINRLASAAVVAGVTTVALATPASAMQVPEPYRPPDTGPAVTESGTGIDWGSLGLGAISGVVLIGAGAAAAAGMRHHRHAVHPV
jgi:hypothetical protein